ncbi:MAG: hypothetical protein ACO2OQ_00725 [Thermofilaceae archaeon]|jgi:hypothetical protein
MPAPVALDSLVKFLLGWLVSAVAVWLALKIYPGKQKRESLAGAALTALVGAIVFWLFKLVKIPFGTVIAWVVWLYLLKRLQGVGWLGAAVLAVLIYIVNAVLGFFLPTIF